MDGDRFFSQGGCGDADQLIERLYDVAYFWRLNPAEVFSLSLSDALELEKHARRIAAARLKESGP